MFRNFGRDLAASLWTLSVLLIPPGMFILFVAVIHPFIGEYLDVNRVWLEWSKNLVLLTMIIAMAVNILLLLIFPALVGGYNAKIKRAQFIAGFLFNLLLSFLSAIFICYWWRVWDDEIGAWVVVIVDNLTFMLILAIHIAMFPAAFVLGSRLVSPAYKRAFWFKKI